MVSIFEEYGAVKRVIVGESKFWYKGGWTTFYIPEEAAEKS